MRQFFKFMFASMLGFILSVVLLFFIVAAIFAAIISSASDDKEVVTKAGTVLHVYFHYPVKDRTSKNPFEQFDFSSFRNVSQPGLNDILANIKKASQDPNISGIYLDLAGLQSGLAVIEDIREQLKEFKKSGKFILAYSDYYTQGSYYLASVADEIWVNPLGVVEFKGLKVEIPFIKGLLAKLEVEPQIIRHGKFKSAIEPLILDKMSEENRLQVATFVNAFWNKYLVGISESRKIDKAVLENIADSLLIQTSADALQHGFVTRTGYKDEFLARLNSRLGKSPDEKIALINLKKYTRVTSGEKKPFTRDKIAVIYADGDIVDGKGNADQIGSESLSDLIRKARTDEKVMAVVMRVNSPGGSALASEVIWREVDLCRKVKPFVVSMGNVAASGGYYISCAADTIVAQPNTVTGSIGVFGLIFNAQKLFNNKLGITFDTYKTGPFADMGDMTRPVTDTEKMVYQNAVERIYDVFTKRVATGRNLSQADVDSIGQGRVWSGTDAHKLGLVDVMGGLNDAIDIAAKMSNLDNYRIYELPEEKDAFVQIMEELSGEAESRMIRYKLGDYFTYYQAYESLKTFSGLQARMIFPISSW